MDPGRRGKAAHVVGKWPARCCHTGSPAGGSVIARERSRTGPSMGPGELHVNLRHQCPFPDEINYHEARQAQRVERARRMIDVGDVIAVVGSRLSQESDPRQHPLFDLANFLLDRQTAVDGAKLYNDWRRRILAAIDTCLDDLLELED